MDTVSIMCIYLQLSYLNLKKMIYICFQTNWRNSQITQSTGYLKWSNNVKNLTDKALHLYD